MSMLLCSFRDIYKIEKSIEITPDLVIIAMASCVPNIHININIS